MYSNLKHTFKQTAIYSLGNISTKLIGFILLPLYTNPKYLSVEEYGIWVTLEVTSQILIGVLALNLPLAMLRFSSSEKNSEKAKSVIFTTIVSLLGIIALSLIFLLPNANFFSRLIFGTAGYSDYFFFLFFYVALGIFNGAPLNILRIKEKSTFYVIVTVLKFTAILLLNIYFVVQLNEGVTGIIKGQLIGEAALTLITAPVVISSIKFKIDFHTLAEMLKYGSPLVLSTISSFILSFGDRYILLHYLDEAKVGIYSLGYKIASVMNMLILQSFQLGFLPIAYKKLGDKDAARFFSKVLTYYAIVLTFTALGLSVFGKELLELLAKDNAYFAAASVIPIISLAFVLKGVQYNFALSFHYSKKTIYNAVIVVITAVVSLALNIILVQIYGFIGSAVAMLVAISFMMVLSYVYGKKTYKIPFELNKLAKIIYVGILLYFIAYLLSDLSFGIRIIVKLFLLAFFPFILILHGIFDKTEKEKLLEIIKWKR